MQTNAHPYPLQVTGALSPRLSRGYWLVKWLLGIPHFILLFFLWIAFAVVSVIAFFAILFTGRYPRGLFDFNVGVLRWSWRVSSTATAPSAPTSTRRSRSRTLRSIPPGWRSSTPSRSRGARARQVVAARPPRSSIVAVFAGGAWAAWTGAGSESMSSSGGLIGLLVVFAGVVLLFTRRYPRPLYDFVLGMNRWVFRVAAYAALMTDVYPPFRLDMGGDEPPADTAPAPSRRRPRRWLHEHGVMKVCIVGTHKAPVIAGATRRRWSRRLLVHSG